MSHTLAIRRSMISLCLRMNRAGLNTGAAGNLSVRTDAGMLITPSGISYEAMTPDQIVPMDWDGNYYGNYLPSSEWRFHHAILKARADANVVLHSHAVHATILACCRLDIPAIHYMLGTVGGPVVKCSGYAPFGTEALSEMALAALEDRNACLLGNHGVIVLGKTMEKAFALLEEVENLARIYIGVRALGGGVLLSDAEMAAALERFKTYGKQPDELKNITVDPANRIVPPPRGGDHLN